jgi:hypothetical protein
MCQSRVCEPDQFFFLSVPVFVPEIISSGASKREEGRREGGILDLEGADHYQWPITSPEGTAVGSKWIHRRVGFRCARPD